MDSFPKIALRSAVGHAVPSSAWTCALCTGPTGALPGHGGRRHLRRVAAQETGGAPRYPEQDFLLALTEPSLQMNVSPRQPAMPPLLPLQGVFVASATFATSSTARTTYNGRDHRSMPRRPVASLLPTLLTPEPPHPLRPAFHRGYAVRPRSSKPRSAKQSVPATGCSST